MILTVTANPCIDKFYLLDSLTVDGVNRVKECRSTAGGKGINVAKAAALLGEEAVATGFLGGHSGEYIRRYLRKKGIRDGFVTVGEETRTCVSIQDIASGTQTELLEPGRPLPTEKEAQLLAVYCELLSQCELVVISGSLPAGAEPSLYSRMVRLAREADKQVILDTSGKLLETGIEACPNVVKPNREELKACIGREVITQADIVRAALEIKSTGIDTVIVSLGGEGAIFVADEGIYHGWLPATPIVSSLGCGDTLVAGVAVGLVRALPLIETIRLSLAAATANALCQEAGIFLHSDMERLLSLVKITKLG